MLYRRPELATNATRGLGVPHPRNDRAPPCHIGRRPRSLWLAQAPTTQTEVFSPTIPVLPGPIWYSLLSPCVSHTKRVRAPHRVVLPTRTYQELANSRARISPHTPR